MSCTYYIKMTKNDIYFVRNSYGLTKRRSVLLQYIIPRNLTTNSYIPMLNITLLTHRIYNIHNSHYLLIQWNRDNSKLKEDNNFLRDNMYYSRYLTRIYINLYF